MTSDGSAPDRAASTTPDILPLESDMLEQCTRCLRLRGSCRPEPSDCTGGLVAAKLPSIPGITDEGRREAA